MPSSKEVTRRIIEKIFTEDESLEIVRSTLIYLEDINQGKFNKEHVDVVCQHGHFSSFFDLYDAYIFSYIHKKVKKGELYYKKLFVGASPSPNAQVEENNRKLRNLPKSFSATFIPSVGRGAEDDGYLRSITDKVFLNRLENGHETEIEISGLNVSLEVGTTESHTTFKHISRSRGIARWPYYSESLYIIYNPAPISIKFQEHVLGANQSEEFPIDESNVASYHVEYKGNSDKYQLLSLFDEINSIVDTYNLPTNFYTFTNSQMDIGILDFEKIDLTTVAFEEICVAEVRNQHNVKTSHLVIRSNSVISVSIDTKATLMEKHNYQFLTISFGINPLYEYEKGFN